MSSVQQKVAAIREQEGVNRAAVAKIGEGTRKIQREINTLTNKIKTYIKNFYFGED